MSLLKVTPLDCDLDDLVQTINIQNVSSSPVPQPDTIEVNLSVDGWTQITKMSGGCPANLPPGTACAIKGNLEDVEAQLDAGQHYSWVRVSWSDGAIDPIEARLSASCEMT